MSLQGTASCEEHPWEICASILAAIENIRYNIWARYGAVHSWHLLRHALIGNTTWQMQTHFWACA
jgi:hypothetical protein